MDRQENEQESKSQHRKDHGAKGFDRVYLRERFFRA